MGGEESTVFDVCVCVCVCVCVFVCERRTRAHRRENLFEEFVNINPSHFALNAVHNVS